MTGKTQALQVLIYKRKLRILLKWLDVVHTLGLRIPSVTLAPLTLMVVPLQDLKSLPDPDAGLIEVVGYRYPPAMLLTPK